MMSGLVNEQAAPVPTDGVAIWELVIADMRARDRVGRERYRVPLQAHNGRDALVDAFQEALDLVVYLRQEIAEREDLRAEVARLRQQVQGHCERIAAQSELLSKRAEKGLVCAKCGAADDVSVVAATPHPPERPTAEDMGRDIAADLRAINTPWYQRELDYSPDCASTNAHSAAIRRARYAEHLLRLIHTMSIGSSAWTLIRDYLKALELENRS